MNYNEILFKLSSEWLCRAIAWDAIVLGSNKQEGKLSGDNYVRAILSGVHYPVAIFRVAIFWG